MLGDTSGLHGPSLSSPRGRRDEPARPAGPFSHARGRFGADFCSLAAETEPSESDCARRSPRGQERRTSHQQPSPPASRKVTVHRPARTGCRSPPRLSPGIRLFYSRLFMEGTPFSSWLCPYLDEVPGPALPTEKDRGVTTVCPRIAHKCPSPWSTLQTGSPGANPVSSPCKVSLSLYMEASIHET